MKDLTWSEGLDLFSALSSDEMEEVERISRTREYQDQQVILQKESIGQALYIILKGRLVITKQAEPGGEIIVGVHDKGDFFGELALLD